VATVAARCDRVTPACFRAKSRLDWMARWILDPVETIEYPMIPRDPMTTTSVESEPMSRPAAGRGLFMNANR